MDDNWAIFLILFAYAIKKDPDCFERLRREEERKKTMRENCPAIEWEQDMGNHIPWCKMTGEPCDFSCMMGARKEASK